MIPLALFVLAGALLLFTLEPMVGRLLLPLHGGGVHVWATCLVTYQGLLFLGYAWAHAVAPRLGRLHLALPLLGLAALPLAVGHAPDPSAPVASLARDLLAGIALPFLALSTTSVVAQHWLARSALPGREAPWALYAVSNAGSLVGLLVYPFVIEPLVGLGAQRTSWTVGYVAWVGLAAVAAWRSGASRSVGETLARPTARQLSLWTALSAAPSGFLVAVTNAIALDAGSMPMMWVLPLVVYLSSFVLVFRATAWFPDALRRYWLHLAVLGAVFANGLGALPLTIAVHLAALFAVCMVGHGELYATRPDARQLTVFYLAMSLGGFVGGAAVALLAPIALTSVAEYPLCVAALLAALVASGRFAWPRGRLGWAAAALFFGVASLRVADRALQDGDLVAAHRNHYGVYRVRDIGGLRYLLHGTTIHGLQSMADPGAPLGYYHRAGPGADVLGGGARRVAIVGLGAGTMAAYFGADADVVYYELDPDNEAVARAHFRYLDDTRAQVRVVAGDARVGLERDPLVADGTLDLFVVDAFSSDAIPTHLLTEEAFALYRRKLAPDGTLLLHVSSRFYDLRPVIRATAARAGLAGAWKVREGALEPGELRSAWYALAPRPERIVPLLAAGWRPDADLPAATAWTDDRASALPLVRRGGIQ